jgi:diketogulonate reductase-like aldo/keto reductase
MNAQSTITLHSGNRMPVMGLGTWELTGEAAVTSVAEALKLGYRMIDTSGDYGNQAEIGEGIRRSGVRREDIYLVTKVEEDEDAYESTRGNLEELGLDHADLMLIHRPPEHGAGQELWDGLIRAKDEGLCRDIGVSNYSIDHIEELTDTSDESPVVNQIEWSPFGHSLDMLRYCRENDIAIQAYSPLTRHERLDEQPIQELADKYEKTPAQILIHWSLQHGVVPIIKASSRRHLEENIDVFDFQFSSQDMAVLDRLNEHYSALPATNKLLYT